METLRPVEVSEYYINRIASGLCKYFWDNIFSEIFDILNNNAVTNSKDDVINAINNGSIWYENGAFRGKFNNAISKTLEEMGAKYRRGAYYISKSVLSFEYLQALGIVETVAKAKANSILKFLGGLALSQIDLSAFIRASAEMMFKKLELDILKSAQEKKIPVIELGIVQPKIKLPRGKWGKSKDGNAPILDINIDDIKLDAKSKKIAEDFTYNMQYWVKNWEVKNIVKMRKDVLKMIQEGARIPRIQEYFEKRWGMAKNKALFLATQESHLASSVIKATGYQAMGCNSFKWLHSTSKEKRELHKTYYDKVFRFEEPPLLDEKLDIKGLPRQIWNCKCQMSPVIPTLDEMLKAKKDNNIIGKIRNAAAGVVRRTTQSANRLQRNNNTWRYRRFGERETL